ncbi:unnamed protein product [Phytophthora fragariaefolia]|uniref:Unnamed protein product n=1 Tax=Phytophthora fragariaefolia TaxID=1490495 RepID=A0A9W6XA89_9STRA|nr:unnamed protein product [Phytophthora fragariaefolia]
MASVDPTTSTSDTSAGRLETYFQAAISRFLKEQQALPSPPTSTGIQNPGSQDAEMLSAGSSDPDPHWEYDPDDIDLPTSDRAAMGTMATGSTGSTMIQRVRISAISDLKEFSGKAQDEDRARAWLGKVKSAFLRDQASDGEKCLTFADLLPGAARNWYHQLLRSTRNKWTDLLRSFQIQYCGFGVSVARQYYLARKRSDESTLEYLHRLNVAGLRARLKIKDGIPKEKTEHVDHFIKTLGDQELTDRLTLLRLPEADELEEVLRALDRAKNRQKKSAFGSSRCRRKAPANPAPAAAAKHLRPIQIQAPDSGSDDSGSERSDSDCDEHRWIYTVANQDNARSAGEEPTGLDRSQPDCPKHDQMTHDHRSRIQNDRIRPQSLYCIYAFVHKPAVAPGNKPRDLHGNTFDLCGKRTPVVSSVCQANDYSRSSEAVVMDLDPECRRGYRKQRDPDLWFEPAVGEVVTKLPGSSRVEAYHSVDTLDLLPRESRGYWKQNSPGKWFRQAKIHGTINNEKAILRLDTGADVSIVDTAFAHKVGCYIGRESTSRVCGYWRKCVYDGRKNPHQDHPGWITDLADGSLCLPDKIRIQLCGRRQLYNDKAQLVKLDQHLQLGVGESAELPVRLRRSGHDKLWVTRGDLWVPTVVNGPGKTTYLQIANVGEMRLVLCWDERTGMWLASDRIPRLQGFVSVGSRRYMEWQNLALQATTDAGSAMAEPIGTLPESMVECPKYRTPRAILRRLDPACIPSSGVGPSGSGDRRDRSSLDSARQPNTRGTDACGGDAIASHRRARIRSAPLDPDPVDDRPEVEDHQDPVPAAEGSPTSLGLTVVLGMLSETQEPETARTPAIRDETIPAAAASSMVDPPQERGPTPDPTDSLDPGPDDSTADERVCYNESGDLHAKDVAAEMAVLPRRHLLSGKGNALPPAARGVVCDINVGNTKPIAQRVRKVAPQFREKWSDLIKGLLGAKIFSVSTSPWASPIVVIIKKNGVDKRLCIDYRLVNSLNRLMIYPMPLINDLLEGLDKVLWYCSLDMASGFWVVTMMDRASAISALITPFGLFEWNRMPFGLKNAPQIYQSILDNALYEFTRIPPPGSSGSKEGRSKLEGSGSARPGRNEFGSDEVNTDPSQDESLDPIKPSVLGRKSYIDDILVTAGSWDHLCDRGEDLLDACDRWNLSISVVKSFLGKSKVEYLGHQVSSSGLEMNPKDLAALTDLSFPQSLRSMQPFLGSLNYYSRFIKDYAIYTAVPLRTSRNPEIQAPEQVDPGSNNWDPSSNGSIGVDPRWTPIPTVLPDERFYVASFDESARVKRGGGAYSAILWELPEWTVVKARSRYAEGLTVNEAEYHGLLLCLDLLEGENRRRLTICGDSNLVIRQVRGEIDFKAPGLTLQQQKALDRLRAWPDHELVYVKRDWNGSADSLASAALQRQAGIMVEDEAGLLNLVTLNRLDEILRPESGQEGSVARVAPVAQDEEAWISGLKTYLAGRIQQLTQDEAKSYSKISMDYDVDLNDLPYYCPPTKHIDSNRDRLMKLVVPETLQQDVLQHYHVCLEGGHQGIGRTSGSDLGRDTILFSAWMGPQIHPRSHDSGKQYSPPGSGSKEVELCTCPKLKLVNFFPDRPQIQLNPDVTRRLDFDESLLPEDSWIQDLDDDEFDVENITDMRTGRRTRFGRVYREFLVHWRGYEDPSWVDEADLNCGAVLHEFLRGRAKQNNCNGIWLKSDKGSRIQPDPARIPSVQRGANLVSIDMGRDPEQPGSSPRSIYQIKNMDQEARSSWNPSNEQRALRRG